SNLLFAKIANDLPGVTKRIASQIKRQHTFERISQSACLNLPLPDALHIISHMNRSDLISGKTARVSFLELFNDVFLSIPPHAGLYGQHVECQGSIIISCKLQLLLAVLFN